MKKSMLAGISLLVVLAAILITTAQSAQGAAPVATAQAYVLVCTLTGDPTGTFPVLKVYVADGSAGTPFINRDTPCAEGLQLLLQQGLTLSSSWGESNLLHYTFTR